MSERHPPERSIATRLVMVLSFAALPICLAGAVAVWRGSISGGATRAGSVVAAREPDLPVEQLPPPVQPTAISALPPAWAKAPALKPGAAPPPQIGAKAAVL